MTEGFWDTVSQDAAAAGCAVNVSASLLGRLWQLRRARRLKPGFNCVFWLRVNQLMIRRGWRGSHRLRMWRQYTFANDISPYAHIGPGFFLPHFVGVTIGANAKIGSGVSIYNDVTLGSKRHDGDSAMPALGDNVIIYTGAKVFGGITIGDNSEVGALSLCNKDVPANSIMYGIPPNVTIKPKKTI